MITRPGFARESSSRAQRRLQKAIGAAHEFLESTREFIADEQLSSADSAYFFGSRKAWAVGDMIEIFAALVGDALFAEDEDLGIVAVIPMAVAELGTTAPRGLDDVQSLTWRSDELPAVHIGRRSAFDGFDNVHESRIPLAWTRPGLTAAAYLRVWQPADSAPDGTEEAAVYLRFFDSEADPVRHTYGLPPF
ncbi:hypothetical protein [Frondihabitans australicus]|uniref:hypothetical protein n=1 Tax=Frondihabitans australicus TaxID=386892 RepID=UPI000EB32BCC|nr:hypothetical protein [Frondihabitans australicus]